MKTRLMIMGAVALCLGLVCSAGAAMAADDADDFDPALFMRVFSALAQIATSK